MTVKEVLELREQIQPFLIPFGGYAMTRTQVIDNVNGIAMAMKQQYPKGLFVVFVPDAFKDDAELKRQLLEVDRIVEVEYREGNTCSIVEKT